MPLSDAVCYYENLVNYIGTKVIYCRARDIPGTQIKFLKEDIVEQAEDLDGSFQRSLLMGDPTHGSIKISRNLKFPYIFCNCLYLLK